MSSSSKVAFNNPFPVSEIDADTLYKGYASELNGLIRIANSGLFNEFLPLFSGTQSPHKRYLTASKKKQIQKLIKNNSIISVNNVSPILKEILYLAHISVCAELMEKVKIPLAMLKPDYLDVMLEKLLGKYRQLGPDSEEFKVLSSKLHSADALRTMQILKFMGLFKRDASELRQLSLGVGSGQKDIRSIHLRPELQVLPNNLISFSVHEQECEHIVLVDGDPQRADLFSQYNENDALSIRAYNTTSSVAIGDLENQIKQGNIAKRNAVIGLRIDYRMIPDVNEFFKLVHAVIDDDADLIITIGSGFDLEDFRGRVQVLQNIHDFLLSRKLSPLLIKLHGDGDLNAQRNSHAFGLNISTTYQILHCKLIKNKLFRTK